MKINTFSILIIIVLVIISIIAFIFIMPWTVLYFGGLFLPNPTQPEITHGEFPFRLVYEINGEKKIVEDVLICEYDGIGMDEGRGKYRKWKEKLKSGNEYITLLNTDGSPGIFYNLKALKQAIIYSPFSANYYMGDVEEGDTYNIYDAVCIEKYTDGSSGGGSIGADELYKKYHIKIVSWDIAKPIKNKFR